MRKILPKYYSTFPSGFTQLVSTELSKDLSDFKLIRPLDGLIEYATSSTLNKIKGLSYLNNSFKLIFRLEASSKKPLEKMIRYILSKKRISSEIGISGNRYNETFRIIFSYENQLVKVRNDYIKQLERKIGKETGLKVNRAKPTYQFWILFRSEGYVYFSLRITKLQKEDKHRSKGQLRPQVADLMVILSEPKEDELFLDPFCGSGIIPIVRARKLRKSLIFASDLDAKNIKGVKEKLKKLKLKNTVISRVDDALNLERFKNNSIHKIVTDPPWGFYEKMENEKEFYSTMLKEFIRVLSNDGLIILLIGNVNLFTEVFTQFKKDLTITEKYNLLVSGKKSFIYKIKKVL